MKVLGAVLLNSSLKDHFLYFYLSQTNPMVKHKITRLALAAVPNCGNGFETLVPHFRTHLTVDGHSSGRRCGESRVGDAETANPSILSQPYRALPSVLGMY